VANALVFDILARDKASKTFETIGNKAEKAGKQGSGFGEAIKRGIGLAAGAAGFQQLAAGPAPTTRLSSPARTSS
jgi:hypothetical protein